MMKLFGVFLIIVVFGSCFAEESSDVVVLTKDNFDTLTKEGKWLLEFYAPWCGHCKKLEPTYAKVATELKGKVNVGKIDCTAETEIGQRFSVQGYPTVKLLNERKLYDYNGDRSQDHLVQFALSEFEKASSKPLPEAKQAAAAPVQEQPAVATDPTSSDVVILSDATFDERTAKGDWLLEFYAPWCGHCKRLAPTYEKVATELKGKANVAKLDCTVETGSCRRFGVKGYPTVKFLKDGQVREYKGDRSQESLVSFVTEGYKTAEASPLPAKKTILDDLTDDTFTSLRIAEKYLREYLWVVLASVLVFGLILGWCIFSTPLPNPPVTSPPPRVSTVKND